VNQVRVGSGLRSNVANDAAAALTDENVIDTLAATYRYKNAMMGVSLAWLTSSSSARGIQFLPTLVRSFLRVAHALGIIRRRSVCGAA